MTIVTIVRQSISNVEAGVVVVCLKADRRRFGPIQRPFQPKTLTEEIQRQQGKRAENKCACVSMKEGRVGGEESGSCGHEF